MTEMFNGIQVVERHKSRVQYKDLGPVSFYKFEGKLYLKIDDNTSTCITARKTGIFGWDTQVEPVDVRIEVLV